MRFKVLSVLIAGTTAATLADAQTGETWATYRGNPARTGSDGQAGPRAATVLWAFESRDHYIASPLPLGDRLYVSGLGAFNRGIFACLSTRPDARTRKLWARQSTGPTVSSPGAFKSWLIFGDGMHQTNGASLYCLDAAEGGARMATLHLGRSRSRRRLADPDRRQGLRRRRQCGRPVLRDRKGDLEWQGVRPTRTPQAQCGYP